MALMPKETAESRLSLQDQVLALLKKAGPRGCEGPILGEVTWRFGSAINCLRAKGWSIDTVKIDGKTYALYILRGPVTPPSKQTDMLQPPAPAKPSAGMVQGNCICHHPRAWHKGHFNNEGCRECACTHFQDEQAD